MASGIIEYLADGSWPKRIHAGWSAQSGLRSALLGKHGFRGPRTVFEGKHGVFADFAPDATHQFHRITNQLGERWEVQHIGFKPYTCGTICQPFIDCAIALSNRNVNADDIVDITCEVGEGSVHRLWEPLSEKRRPVSPYSAKFSVPYCIAVGFFDGCAGFAQFTEERLAHPKLHTLASKVNYVIDPENEYPSKLTGHLRATLRDGTVHEIRQAHFRGGSSAPLSRNEILTKFQANTVFGGWNSEQTTRLRQFCESIETQQNLTELRRFRN
jgi:2-methylcitrate dehydratase PrpD